jgi:hypothetical protein
VWSKAISCALIEGSTHFQELKSFFGNFDLGGLVHAIKAQTNLRKLDFADPMGYTCWAVDGMDLKVMEAFEHDTDSLWWENRTIRELQWLRNWRASFYRARNELRLEEIGSEICSIVHKYVDVVHIRCYDSPTTTGWGDDELKTQEEEKPQLSLIYKALRTAPHIWCQDSQEKQHDENYNTGST